MTPTLQESKKEDKAEDSESSSDEEALNNRRRWWKQFELQEALSVQNEKMVGCLGVGYSAARRSWK